MDPSFGKAPMSLISILALLFFLPHIPRAAPPALNRAFPAIPPPAVVPRPRPLLVNRPRPPFTPNINPLTTSGRVSPICLNCQANGASSNGASSNGASSNGVPPNGTSSNGASLNGASPNGASSSPQSRSDLERNMEEAFGENARSYDNSYHSRMAADYIKWMALKPGQRVLDMACGTGLVSIAAKKIVGPSGLVVGIDVSPGMLAEAKRKATDAKQDVTFLKADVENLDNLALPSEVDVITCSAAFVLLDNRIQTLRQWTSYLKPGGRIILDINTASSRLTGQVLALIADELGVELGFPTTREQLAGTLRRVLEVADLMPLYLFASPVYQTREYDKWQGLRKLRQALDGPFAIWDLDSNERNRAEELYVQEYKKQMGPDGLMREDIWFYVGIGEKQTSGKNFVDDYEI